VSRLGRPTRPVQAVAPGQKWCVGFSEVPGHAAPLSDFRANIREKDGLTRLCAPCIAARRKRTYVSKAKPKAPKPVVVRPPKPALQPFTPGTDIYIARIATECRLADATICEGPLALDPDGQWLLCRAHRARLDDCVAGRIPRLTRGASIVPKVKRRTLCRCGGALGRAENAEGLCRWCYNKLQNRERHRMTAAAKRERRAA
jgi:hypothetical protein